jgi:hypothetical protein
VIAIPHRRRRLLFRAATVEQGGERLEQGALTLAALATLAAIWLGIGLQSLPSVFSRQDRSENETPLVAYTEDSAQPRPHAAPTIPVGKNKAMRRHGHRSAPQLVRATSATDGRTSPNAPAATSTPTVASTGADQPRVETAAPIAAAGPTHASVTTTESTVAPQTAGTTEAATTSHGPTTTNDPPTPPTPPVTVPSLPNLPDVPDVSDVPLPTVPLLSTLPPPPTVTAPQTPLPAVAPTQLPPVQTPTLPTLP